jgi:streptogramin lyase
VPAVITVVAVLVAEVVTKRASDHVFGGDSFQEFADRLGSAFVVAMGVWHLAYAAFVWWAARIGQNERSFGPGLVISATYPWYLLLTFAGILLAPRAGLLWLGLGSLCWLAVWVLRWRPFITRLWHATGFPPALSILGWLPALVILPLELAHLAGLAAWTQVAVFAVAMVAATIIQHRRSTGTADPTEAKVVLPTTAAILVVLALAWVVAGGTLSGAKRAVTDATGTTSAQRGRVDGRVDNMTYGYGSLWALSQTGKLTQLDAGTLAVRRTVQVGYQVQVAVVTGGGSVWAVDATGLVTKVDPATGQITGTVKTSANFPHATFGAGSLWVTTMGGVERIDARSNRLTKIAVPLGSDPPGGISFGGGSAWLSYHEVTKAREAGLYNDRNLVSRIDPATNQVIPLMQVPEAGDRDLSGLVRGGGSVWLLRSHGGTAVLVRVEVAGGKVTRFPVRYFAQQLSFAAGSAWVTDDQQGHLLRLDPKSDRPVEVHTKRSPFGTTGTKDRVWVWGLEDVEELKP